ncbi:MAG: hypothetical protein ACR2NZ_21800 [Rubripirellula sp.]
MKAPSASVVSQVAGSRTCRGSLLAAFRSVVWMPCLMWFGLMWLGLAVSSTSPVQGDELLGPFSPTLRLPGVGGKAVGFRTSIRVPQYTTVGYVPVEITVNGSGAIPSDRRLVYRFKTVDGGQTPPQNGLEIDVPILVPQGTRSATWVRYLPKWSAGLELEVTVLEDGRPLPEFNDVIGGGMRAGRRRLRSQLDVEYSLNWVFVGSDVELNRGKLPSLQPIWPEAFGGASASPAFWSQMLSGPTLLAVGQDELPTDWRGYQQYDVLVISTKGAEALTTKSEQWRAMRGWMLNGGTIVVYDAETPESIADTLGVSWTGDADARERVARYASEYQQNLGALETRATTYIAELQLELKESEGQGNGAVTSSATMSSLRLPLATIKKELKEAKAEAARLAEEPHHSLNEWTKRVQVQSVGSGELICLRRIEEGELPPKAYWDLVNDEIDFRASPVIRRGVDPMVGDRRFSRWLIPGVAQPPVYTFMGLLTAFVILVGPVAYRRTAKQGRSYLMFAIAPVLALITTVAMFGYGIVSDGFGTVVRVRQLTWVDGNLGDAGERVRATYFAGVRPGDGLRFAGDAEVIGYREGTGDAWEELDELAPSVMGKISIREDLQRFDSSFLPSRQQKQFVTHQPRYEIGRLQLTPDPKGIAAPRVSNGFSFAMRELVVRDRLGVYWQAMEVAPGQSVKCKALTVQDASKALGKLYRDNRPVSAVRERSQVNQYRNLIFDVVTDVSRNLGTKTTVNEGVFEYWLQAHLQTSGDIPRSHFVGLSEISADVLAVENCEVSSSVRYVFGTLP